MHPRLAFDPQARTFLLRGFNHLAALMEVALGPRGRLVAVARDNPRKAPELLNDGATLARRFLGLPNRFETMGAFLARHIAWRMEESVGDGATTAVVIARQVLNESAFVTDHLALAATPAGVYRSTDGGQQWAWSGRGINDPLTRAIAFAPTPHKGVQPAFVSTQGARLFRSADGGVTWSELITWAGLGTISNFAFSPTFATDQTFFVTTDAGVFRTQDGGQSWANSTFGLHDLHIAEGRFFACLAIAGQPAQELLLYVSDHKGSIYAWEKHRDFRLISTNVPWMDDMLLHLAVSPYDATGQTLLAVSGRRDTTGHYRLQLWESSDGGGGWEPLAALVSEILSVALAWPVDLREQALFVATRHRVIKLFYQGENRDLASTQSFLDPSLNITALAASPTFAQDRTLWAATTRGVYQSTDGGSTWQPVDAGLDERSVVAVLPPVVNAPLRAVTLGGELWQLVT